MAENETADVRELTTFYVFKGSDDLMKWELVGSYQARDRDHAIRQQYPDWRDGLKFPVVAVSEHAWQPRQRVEEQRPVAVLQVAAMPVVPASEEAAAGRVES